ncbi:diguanylate cyclase [Corallococcus praedator]|uniref:diguanylate cyclase n=1 Tax=Corallococcus praedator TaxID=2316724 RepID=A0ABX9QKA4_9BACT|nr:MULTISPECIES: diguanylate cyclase [Corallococcus]RKH35994.1 diguanylate cyclase [Corallococcus sp. CA031C]RKI10152.1 diguanylate cyclase [Corallococcus praedator]
MKTKPFTLLVVDDSQALLPHLVRTLGPEDFALRVARSGPEALGLTQEVDGVLLCPGETNPTEAHALLEALTPPAPTSSRPPVLVLSPPEDKALRLAALRRGAELILTPWDEEELRLRLYRSLETYRKWTELHSQVEELRRLAVTDGLTQVHNHRYFQERLREEFRRAQRYDESLSLILVDLDHFKNINDGHGHGAGDRVLREVAASLQHSVRETDLVARYGGEEFAILLPCTHLPGALTVAERVRRGVSDLHAGPEGALRVTASLGVSSFPHRAILTPEQLLLTADEALYRAKREGRDRICLHPPAPLFSAPPSRVG